MSLRFYFVEPSVHRKSQSQNKSKNKLFNQMLIQLSICAENKHNVNLQKSYSYEVKSSYKL